MNTQNKIIHQKIPSERYTPFSLSKKLNAIAVLESASFSQGKQRYSIVMVEEAFKIIEDDKGRAFIIDGQRQNIRTELQKKTKDILDILTYVSSQNSYDTNKIPLPTSGIGYLSYEFCAKCDSIVLAGQKDEIGIASSSFIVGHIYIVFDHFNEEMHIFGLNYNEHKIDLETTIEKLKARILDLDFSYLSSSANQNKNYEVITDLEESKNEFISTVNTLKEHIVKGDLLQAVASRRLQIKSDVDALEVYRKLRLANPSPYMFYMNFGDYQIVGASPESLVRVQNGEASIRPIAGTRRRGKNDAEDEKLKIELASDKKEIAEHLMLVDLARNDLGRVCEAGSVKVEGLMRNEMFSHVMHLVSDVYGKVDKNYSAIDVLRSSFPAGTVSGAPKIKAIEILSGLEKKKRSFYAGAVGYINAEGGLDYCISIRCALKQGSTWTLQAGAGIVYHSVAEREWEETNEKLASMLTVLTE